MRGYPSYTRRYRGGPSNFHQKIDIILSIEIDVRKVEITESGKNIELFRYDESDEISIASTFFTWKTAAKLAGLLNTKRPNLPLDFTEPIVCYLLGLWHKKGRGHDAYKLNSDNEIVKRIEIKSTVTPDGFQRIKIDTDWDEVYWLDFSDHENLNFEIFKFDKIEVLEYLKSKHKQSKDKRKPINFRYLVNGRQPIKSIKIGFISLVD